MMIKIDVLQNDGVRYEVLQLSANGLSSWLVAVSDGIHGVVMLYSISDSLSKTELYVIA